MLLVLFVAAVLSGAAKAFPDTCSGRGLVYEEEAGLGVPLTCSCFQCFGGDDCETMDEQCQVFAMAAESTLWAEWWANHSVAVHTDVSALYHMGYMQNPRLFPAPQGQGVDKVSLLLVEAITGLHAAVGNANVSDYHLVLGSGGVQLIDAALYALTQGPNTNRSMRAFAQTPYYPHFRQASNLNPLTQWLDDTTPRSSVDPGDVIEVVTSPNNPDNRKIDSPVFPTNNLITDYVYRWPSYTTDLEDKQAALSIWSLSKLSGFAASRIGWALVKDRAVAETMSDYIFLQTTSASPEAQLRAVKVLQTITKSVGTDDDFFVYAKGKLQSRWNMLESLFANQTAITLEGEPGNLFLWAKCSASLLRAGNDCASVFGSVGILADSGVGYGATAQYARVCIGHHDSTFAVMFSRLHNLLHHPPSAFGTGTTCPLSHAEALRATQRKPGHAFKGSSAVDMARRLNEHLRRGHGADLDLQPCDRFSLSQLHDLQRVLFPLRHAELQATYASARDTRRAAFGDGSLPGAHEEGEMERRLGREMAAAKAGGARAHDVVRDGACHRVVMQLVHHVPAGEAKTTLKGVRFPMLPEYETPLAEEGPGMVEARRLYDNATSCLTCHVDYPNGTAGPVAPPHLPSNGTVLWPEEFDVRFGLYTEGLTNVSSHMHFSSIVPGMFIHHDACPPQFPTNHPGGITGQCNFLFKADGFYIIWPSDEAKGKGEGVGDVTINCCQSVASNLTLNLGRDELGGFVLMDNNATALDLYGNPVHPLWTNGPRLQPPANFSIYVNGTTGHDVHYHNGGPYFLEWALAPFNVAPQNHSLFDLPGGKDCSFKCHDGQLVGAHKAVHSHLRSGFHPLHAYLNAFAP